MSDFFFGLAVICLIMAIVGLFRPQLVLWRIQNKTRAKALGLYLALFFLCGIVGAAVESPAEKAMRSEKERQRQEQKLKEEQANAAAKAQEAAAKAAQEAAEREQKRQEELRRQEQNEKSYKASCQKYAYRQLARNPEQYLGARIVETAKVLQVVEQGQNTVLRVRTLASPYGSDETFWLNYQRKAGESRFLENDVITFYGDFLGIKQYTAVMGNQVAVPQVNVRYIERLSQ